MDQSARAPEQNCGSCLRVVWLTPVYGNGPLPPLIVELEHECTVRPACVFKRKACCEGSICCCTYYPSIVDQCLPLHAGSWANSRKGLISMALFRMPLLQPSMTPTTHSRYPSFQTGNLSFRRVRTRNSDWNSSVTLSCTSL
jgi:hypothetical protein